MMGRDAGRGMRGRVRRIYPPPLKKGKERKEKRRSVEVCMFRKDRK